MVVGVWFSVAEQSVAWIEWTPLSVKCDVNFLFFFSVV